MAMKKLSNFFYKLSTGWLVLAIFLVFLLFLIFVMPVFSEKAAQYSNGMVSPDTSLFYSGEDLYRMAQGYGQAGRQSFVDIRWTLDLLFPFVYTAFFIITTSWFLRRIVPFTSKLRVLNLVPLAAFVFDLLENSATSLVMIRYPSTSPLAQALAPVFTPIKWFAVVGSFFLLLIVTILWIIKRVRETKK
jgi:hypothetical protein